MSTKEKADQYDVLLDLIQEKVACSNTPKQIQLLTLAPQTCSRKTLAKFFGVSDYIIRESREVFKEKVILGDIEPKTGRCHHS